MDNLNVVVTQPAVPLTYSITGAHPCSVSGRADSAPDLDHLCVVIGKAGAPPTTFAGFTAGTTITHRLVDDSVTWRINGVTQSFSAQFAGSLPGTVSLGDTLYVALFDVAAPAGADPVIALAATLTAGA